MSDTLRIAVAQTLDGTVTRTLDVPVYLRCGVWAVTKSRKRPTERVVTHVPTGFAASVGLSPRRAAALCRTLHRIAPRYLARGGRTGPAAPKLLAAVKFAEAAQVAARSRG